MQELLEYAYQSKSVVVLLEVLLLGAVACEKALMLNHAVFLYS